MTWTSPFSLAGQWYKGNLHTHTTQSDGTKTPQEAIAWYREHGYDFLALTDHWVHTPGAVISPGFITLAGAELHGQSYHMLAVGLRALPNSALQSDPAALAAEVQRLGGLPFFAHPYWTGQAAPSLISAPDVLGVEVYNSTCDQVNGLGYARAQWDEAMALGARFWGLAVDDVHWHGEQGRGFVMVRAATLDEAAILQALRLGHFYASTGPLLADLRLERDAEGRLMLRVLCSPCQSITFYGVGPCGCRFIAPRGETLQSAAWPLRDDQVYLRVECEDAEGRIAWSNPVWTGDLK